jgi:hypothetical protein
MSELDRKGFLKLSGLGSASLVMGGLPLASHHIDPSGRFTFSGSVGLPRTPLPSYATQIVEGQVDLERGRGLVTSRVVAGHPEDTSYVGLPGLTRTIRVTSAEVEGGVVRLHGLIEDRSQLRRGESHSVEIVVDRKSARMTAPFLGSKLEHTLAT